MSYENALPSEAPHFAEGDGDGTVNLQSLEGCLRWKNVQQKSMNYKKFGNIGHLDILNSPAFIDHLRGLFMNEQTGSRSSV